MNFLMDELLQEKPYQYDGKEKEPGGRFYQAVLEELCFHFENNALYRRFCQNKGFDPHNFKGKLSEIPPVQVSVFKELGNRLNSVSKDSIKLTLQSSATSGIPSSIPVDKITAKRQRKAMVRVISDFIGDERRPFLVMDVDPASGFRDILGARFAAVSGYLNFASQVGYFLKVNENRQYYFDVPGIEKYIADLDKDEPAVVFGFTYILYSEVIKPLTERGCRFPLPQGSKILHIGGWKKLEREKVDRAVFNQKAAELFGIAPSDVIDVYGFTEQMGLNYPDCICGSKHAPLYSEVIVRDVVTKEVLPPGKEGLLEFISPLPHSYPGNVVLTDDLGILDDGPCENHRVGTRFRMTGRLKKAEIRGCGDILSSKLKFADSNLATKKTSKQFRVEYFYGYTGQEETDPKLAIKNITGKLQESLSWIRKQPVDALIGLIATVAEKWKNRDLSPELVTLRSSGLGFLASWCSAAHLNELLTRGLNGNRHYVDAFLPVDASNIQMQRAVSKGLVCHWLAGNVQVLGMFVLIESILTKNVNLLKVSSRDNGVFKALLQSFEGVEYTTPGGYTIKGNDLLKTIAVIFYPHTNEAAGKEMSALADVRVAWGGRESVTTVSSYPSKFDCADLIMGPKLSFSVVASDNLQDDHKIKKLARKVAVDASVFDQTGCASAHNVFVERGGKISPEEFAARLADGMRKEAMLIPKQPMTPEQVSAIHSARGIYDFKGKVYGDPDSVWTVLYSDDMELNAPVYSRVVFVHPVDDILDVVRFVNDDIQTIGLAADGEKACAFATAAAERGAVRFPACGKMLNFDSPWDGMYLTDRMVRWVTLGGPFV